MMKPTIYPATRVALECDCLRLKHLTKECLVACRELACRTGIWPAVAGLGVSAESSIKASTIAATIEILGAVLREPNHSSEAENGGG